MPPAGEGVHRAVEVALGGREGGHLVRRAEARAEEYRQVPPRSVGYLVEERGERDRGGGAGDVTGGGTVRAVVVLVELAVVLVVDGRLGGGVHRRWVHVDDVGREVGRPPPRAGIDVLVVLVDNLDGVLAAGRAGLRRAGHTRALPAGLGPLVVRVRLVNLAVLRGRRRLGLLVCFRVGIGLFLALVARGLRGGWLVLGHELLVGVHRVSGRRHRLRDRHGGVRCGVRARRRFELGVGKC